MQEKSFSPVQTSATYRNCKRPFKRCSWKELEYSLGRKNCLLLEDIHGGLSGIMEVVDRIGEFDIMTSDFIPITRVVVFFKHMIRDYKAGPEFTAQLGWHVTGEPRQYYFK